MKKVVFTLMAALLSVTMMAQVCQFNNNGLGAQNAATKGATKDAAPTWSTIHTPFSTMDINGNPVNVADTLAAGKYIVIDYSATWCNPCYRFHQSKNLEAIHNQLGSQVCVLWVEADNSTTLADIQGTGSNTQGDWTHYTDGSAVSYPIIDCHSCESMIDPTGYVPAVYFVTPNGYYCHIYGETWGLSISMTNAEAVANIQALMANAPAAGQLPSVNIAGPGTALVGQTKQFTANVVSVDNITNVTWTATGGTVVSGDATGANISFNATGMQTVTLSVTNTTGTQTATLQVNVRDGWSFGDEMDYTEGNAFQSSIGYGGNGEISWGVLYPESLMAGRNYVTNVSIYVENAGQYDLRIYQGGTSNPQNLVYENSYNMTTTEAWVDLPIYGGAPINPSQNLWVTLHCNGVNYPAAYCAYNGDPNSHLIDGGTSWVEITDLAPSLDDVTWMIKTTTSASAPAFDFLLNGPASVMNGETATFSIAGPNDATYSWTLQGATPATATGMSATASWATPGSYTVTVQGTRNGSVVTKTLNVTVSDGSINLPFYDDFESGLNYWSTVDVDGDGYTWTFNGFEGHNGSTNAIASASYINNIGVLTPDNWLISNTFTVPGGGATIEWWEYGVDNNDYADNYSVYVSENGGNEPADFMNGLLFNGAPTSPKTWVKHSRNISSGLAGRTVRVAFRHHDITNMYWLLIDDVKITAGNTAGIEETGVAKVDFYPNPVTDKLYISEEVHEVSVLDVNGRTIMSETNTRVIDMSNLANGVYIVRVVTNDGIATKKIVKK